VLGLFVFGLLAAAGFRSSAGTPWLIFVLVVVFRFLLGGGPFDIYYGLTLVLAVSMARGWVALTRSGTEVRQTVRKGEVR
jgi:hypothetical protein